ncbi:MAG: DinB family protein [Actinomycetota bacterium]
MRTAMLDDAFSHHVWATRRLIGACAELSPKQLETSVPGTYGSIVETLRHLVDTDAWYAYRLNGEPSRFLSAEAFGFSELHAAMEGAATAWSRVLATDPDPGALVVGIADDGTEVYWPTSIRVAQALHHGTDHRSQICTALTTIGVVPPAIDVWDFAEQDGRLATVPSPAP